MKKKLYSFSLTICYLLFSQNVIAQNWSSIIPSKSTRTEVERILGVCENYDPLSCLYKTEKQNILIIYNTLKPCEDGLFNIPKGTVISMSIFPQKSLMISDLDFNMKNFTEKDDPEIVGVKQYYNYNEGVTIEAIDNRVIGIYYGASEENRKLYKCKNVSKG